MASVRREDGGKGEDGVMIDASPQNDNDETIILEDVRKTYQMGRNEVHALAGVSISFKRGSF